MWTTAGWRFARPVDGHKVADVGTGAEWQFSSGSWIKGVLVTSEVWIEGHKVLGRKQPAIDDANGGSVIDTDARRALAEILAALRSHGLISA